MNRRHFRLFAPVLGWLVATAGVLMTIASASGFEPADKSEVALYDSRICPLPQSVLYGRGVVVFNSRLRCELAMPGELAESDEFRAALEGLRENERRDFCADFPFVVRSVADAAKEAETLDASRTDEKEFFLNLAKDNVFFSRAGSCRMLALTDPSISADAAPEEIIAKQDESAGTLVIAAHDLSGFRDAFKTLRQLAEVFGSSMTTETSRHFIPELLIDDAPRLDFRGLHLCWFPETEVMEIERSIRTAAYMKFNYIVLEFWGVYPFEACDALCWEEFRTSKEEVQRLVRLAKDLGVHMIPQINLFGHAPFSRSVSAKHSTLDFHPELEPLFTPDGWTWNIYNPATRELLGKCVLELWEAFDHPTYFHIGCDEAESAGTDFIARRRGDYEDALTDWLKYFHDMLAERNCRIMMWHDMLIKRADFPGYIANGKPVTVGLVDRLPKDVVICDWQYGKPKENETWPTLDYFAKKGFDVLACPWNSLEGIKSLADNVAQNKRYGVLCTTWHTFHGGTQRNILRTASQAAWGARYQNVDFTRLLRQANRDTLNKNYRTGGVFDWQLLPQNSGPQ